MHRAAADTTALLLQLLLLMLLLRLLLPLLLLMIMMSTAILDCDDTATDHDKRGDKRMTNTRLQRWGCIRTVMLIL